MEPVEKEETKIKFFLESFLKYLSRNIDWKDLIFDYHEYTPAQREQIRHIGRQHPEEVTERCLEMILNDVQTERKYIALLNALEHAKNQKVIDILKGNLIPTNETNRTMMYRYGRTICEELIATDIVDPLCAVGVLDDKGRQEIQQKANMSGKWEAAFSLLFLLPNKNTEWYQHFISTLLKTNYESLARRIDESLCMKIEAAGDNDLVSGDFTSCRFVSSNTKVGMPYDDIISDAVNPCDEIDGDGSIREHVVSDYYEPSLNNLDDPPPPIPPLPYSSIDTETSNLSIELIHTQAEEKLSNIDCNLQSSDVKTKIEKMASINKNIPIEQDKSTRRTEQSILNSFESVTDLQPNSNLSDSVSSEMFDFVEDCVRLTILNPEARTSSPVQNESEKSTAIVGKLTALNIENYSVVALHVYDSNKMHLMSVGNTVLLSNYAINNDIMIVTYKTDVYPIEIGNKHVTMPRQKEKESLKTTDLSMPVSKEASKATACISVSEAACSRNKTVCTVKGKVTKKQQMGFAGTCRTSDDADKKDKESVTARNVVTDNHRNGFCQSYTNIKGRSMSNRKHGVLYTVIGIKTLDPYRSCIREECKRKQINKATNICPVCKMFYSCTESDTTYSLSAHGKVRMKKPDGSDELPSFKIFTHHLEELCACVGVEMDLNNVQTTKENIVAKLPVTLELEMHDTKISKFIRKI